MDDFQAEVLAVTNFHHFLLEVMLANEFAGMPNGEAELAGFAADMVDRMERRSTFRPGEEPTDEQSIEDAAEIAARSVVIARRFFQRAQNRRDQIASARKRMGA